MVDWRWAEECCMLEMLTWREATNVLHNIWVTTTTVESIWESRNLTITTIGKCYKSSHKKSFISIYIYLVLMSFIVLISLFTLINILLAFPIHYSTQMYTCMLCIYTYTRTYTYTYIHIHTYILTYIHSIHTFYTLRTHNLSLLNSFSKICSIF